MKLTVFKDAQRWKHPQGVLGCPIPTQRVHLWLFFMLKVILLVILLTFALYRFLRIYYYAFLNKVSLIDLLKFWNYKNKMYQSTNCGYFIPSHGIGIHWPQN